MKFLLCYLLLFMLCGCENADVGLATQAGLDAVKAITLSDEAIKKMADQAINLADQKNKIGQPDSKYARRLDKIVAAFLDKNYDCKVYFNPEINAFAMANGAIRINSGLMEMMSDDEVRFVIGHEVGHIDKLHIRKQMQLAYAGSALRKGLAAQNSIVGEIAGSQLGGFVEVLLNAQFSQQEEREADDYGLAFLPRKGCNPASAGSALRKLATLQVDHSFLASHPAPGVRADRLEGKPDPQAPQAGPDYLGKIISAVKHLAVALLTKIQGALSGG